MQPERASPLRHIRRRYNVPQNLGDLGKFKLNRLEEIKFLIA
jgi:hypothetical protein